MNLRSVIRDLCPPAIPKLIRRLSLSPERIGTDEQIVYAGDYQSWQEAERMSSGYADPEIVARTRAAMLKVKSGEAAFERDSVTFQVMEHRFPVLAGLLRAAATSGGRLNVVDFGGSLGSTYFQCRQFLSVVKELRWNVVEQSAHVTCGQAEFANDQLRFYRTLDDCLHSERPDVLLMSSVLQYMPLPYETLEDLLKRGFEHVIIDRTSFLECNRDRLTVQTVPEAIYPARYPAWFFSESKFMATLRDAGYMLVADFAALETRSPDHEKAYSKGFILEKKGGSPTSRPVDQVVASCESARERTRE